MVRERATGPAFALVVIRCHTHRKAFTLYPPGYAPYARRIIAPVGPDGGMLRPEGKVEKAERFRDTLFDAALDAADGCAWFRDHVGGTDHWWHTQQRHLERAQAIFGLLPATDSSLRHELAETLAIEGLVLEEQTSNLRAASVGYRERGEAVRAVLANLAPTPLLADRLLEAGYLAGYWGAPYRWLADAQALRRCPFRAARTIGTKAPRRPP
jgi:hypothetical protein